MWNRSKFLQGVRVDLHVHIHQSYWIGTRGSILNSLDQFLVCTTRPEVDDCRYSWAIITHIKNDLLPLLFFFLYGSFCERFNDLHLHTWFCATVEHLHTPILKDIRSTFRACKTASKFSFKEEILGATVRGLATDIRQFPAMILHSKYCIILVLCSTVVCMLVLSPSVSLGSDQQG